MEDRQIRHFSLTKAKGFRHEDNVVTAEDPKTGERTVLTIYPKGEYEYGTFPALCGQAKRSGNYMCFSLDWEDVSCIKCLKMGEN